MKLFSPVSKSTTQVFVLMISQQSTWYCGNKLSTLFLYQCVVWCGMINDMVIGPVILGDRTTGHNYLDFLQNGLPGQLEDVPLVTHCYVLSA
jgi:hypothetical protein